MKNTLQYMLMLCTVLLTSCNLFIDEDLERELREYSGRGYDKVVSDSADNFKVDYQYKSTTLELNADNPLTQHIVRVETIDSAGAHTIYFDASTPENLLPQVGQHIVSNNLDVFPFGLCALVGIVEKSGGEWVVNCKNADVKDAFEYLDFHASIPVGDYFDEYDIYDEDGEFLAHIDNREENAAARTRSDDGEKFINVNIPFDLPLSSDRLTEWRKKFYNDHFKLTFTGGIKGKLYADCDFDWDEGLNIKFKFKDGSFEFGIKIETIGGMPDSKKVFGNNDLLNGKVRLTVGPVVVVPVFGFSVNAQVYGSLTTEIKYKKPFDFEIGFADGDFYSKDNSGKSTLTTKFEAACNFDFPVVKISLGFGLFSSDLSIRAEVYAKLATKASVATGTSTFFDETDEPVHIDYNPKLTTDFQLGFAVALVAKGMIIKKVLKKIKEYVKDRSSGMKALSNYMANGSYSDWIAFKQGKLGDIKPSVLEEMEKCLGGTKDEARANLIDEWIRTKQKENQGLRDPSFADMTGHVVEPGEGEDDKEFALRLGPFYPDKLKWPLVNRYMFPKMKEGSFKVGQKWTAADQDIIFSGEWAVEDPGFITYAKTLYPCFTIMSGSEELFTLFPENVEDAELNGSTPKNKKYTVEIPHLEAEYPYTCIPGYALSYEGRPVVQDKGLAFCTVTPTISIVKLVETDHSVDVIGETSYAIHHFHFDTYSNVKGSVNIKEWGIYDNTDINPLTARHKSKSATLQSGNYVHHWSVTTTKTKIQIDLSPYIFGRDALNTINFDYAKKFPAFKKKLKYEFDFSDDSRRSSRVIKKAEGDVPDYERDYELKLDSVTYEGVRIM